jgi:hypothetical protein
LVTCAQPAAAVCVAVAVAVAVGVAVDVAVGFFSLPQPAASSAQQAMRAATGRSTAAKDNAAPRAADPL